MMLTACIIGIVYDLGLLFYMMAAVGAVGPSIAKQLRLTQC